MTSSTQPPGIAEARTGAGVPSYGANAESHARRRDAQRSVSLRISRFRLATFLPGAVLLVWALARGVTPVPLAVSALLFAAFAVLVVWHARVEERIAWYDALRLVNARGHARLARDWAALPAADAPADLDLARHPYALDLDLFGRASLFQWLGPAATALGRATLAHWILSPASRDTILQRQSAVDHLAPLDAWREQFAAHGVLAADAARTEVERFLDWAEGSDPFGRLSGPVRIAVLLITASIWLLLVLHMTGAIPGALWLLPVTAGVVVSFALNGRMIGAFNRAGAGQDALQRYAQLLEHAVRVPDSPGLLAALRQRFSAHGALAPQSMRRLNLILGFADLRRGAAIFHFLIHAVTLWDFHASFALERWRRRNGAHIRGWLEALGELDALALLAGTRRDHAGWCFPEIAPEPLIEAGALGHPLIPDHQRVANDVTIGPPGTLLLVTGSNMSGKSTLLRAIGLNVVLAQAGGCICAARMRMSVCEMQTSIRVQDSLELGLSYFMAALARLKGVVDAAERKAGDRQLVYLLDEILQGTNTAERSIAVRAVARHLLEAGAIGAMTTHDLSLAGEEPVKSAARLVHFTEIVDEGGAMRFDYRLRPGLATSRNALRLMQLIGIGVRP